MSTTPKKTATKAAPKKEVAPLPDSAVMETVFEVKQDMYFAPPKGTRSLSNAIDADAIANELAAFIKHNKLSTNVQGKDYVNVEGWQYAGSRLGIVAIVDHTINVSSDQEIKYQAKVSLLDLRTNQTVGAGFALCSNKEQGKKFYQEFAIMSMAQTRAIGKAFRVAIAWMIRAAGYEPTPAEEMEYGGNTPTASPVVKHKEMYDSDQESVTVQRNMPPPSDAVPQEVRYASASQKEEIIRLLNHHKITRPEKTKMLLNINRLDEERADQAIAKLKKAIDDRLNENPVK